MRIEAQGAWEPLFDYIQAGGESYGMDFRPGDLQSPDYWEKDWEKEKERWYIDLHLMTAGELASLSRAVTESARAHNYFLSKQVQETWASLALP